MSGRNRIGVSLVCAVVCFAAAANAELVITEIMSQSAHVGSSGDWWELTNTGPWYINLTGYSWDDDHQRPGQNVFGNIGIGVGESIIILDHGSAEVAVWRSDWKLTDSGVNAYDTSYFPGGFSSLGSSDGVFLYDTFGALVTSATYPSRAAGISNEWAEDGTSLGLSVAGENGAYASSNSREDVGSPGYAVEREPCSSSGRMMYWTDKSTAKIQRMNLDSRCVEDILTSSDGLVEPRGLAIDIGAGKMYWADTVTGVIHQADLDGRDDVHIATGLSDPADIALDADLGKIYFSETDYWGGSGKIRCVNADGSGPIQDIVTDIYRPYYIELDLTNSRIYWSDVDNSVIHRANLDGTGGEVFIAGLSHVRDIVLDLPGGKIYWGDRGSSKIQRVNLDGTGGIEDLFDWTDGLDRPHGLLLDPDAGKIYWTDTVTCAVHRGNMDGNGAVEDLVVDLDDPWALAIVMVQEVKYVDADAAGANDGSNWEDAFNYLRDALSAARQGDEIRVAQGIYKPDKDTDNPAGTGDREAAFKLKNGVTLKGGYAGFGEPDPDKRDIAAHETILSGDLAGNDKEVSDPCDLLNEPTRSENSYHVVSNSNIDKTAVIDGFTITAGNANGTMDDYTNAGGGMLNNGHDMPCNPTVTRCTFVANSASEFGAAMFNYGHGDGESNPTVTGCAFIGNAAGQEGGGICNWEADAVATNCTFSQNFAHVGGAIDNMGGNPLLTDCTFADNSASYGGGAMWNYETASRVIGCIFSGNSAQEGGAILNHSRSTPTFIDCKFIANTADSDGGGICNIYGSSPTLTNCLFTANSADARGGGIYGDGQSDSVLTNCTLSRNYAQSAGGGICSHFNAYPTLTNCILWSNQDAGGVDESAQIDGGVVTVSYSCIQGLDTLTGNNNIPDDPLFRDDDGPDNILGTSDDDLRLDVGSPCIEGGDSAAIPAGVLTDLAGEPRIIDAYCDYRITVDMGAYEFSYAYLGDFDYDCDIDFKDYAVLGTAWWTEPEWNPVCNIGIPKDTKIDARDLKIFAENWLATLD